MPSGGSRGIGSIRGIEGLLGSVGGVRAHGDPSGSVGVSGVHWVAARECRCSGASRGISSIRGHWEAPRGEGASRAPSGV